MRRSAVLLSMLFALNAGATELWRWKDADGVVHYSDRPVQGAERIDVRSQKSSGEITPKATAKVTPAPPPAQPVVNYTRCVVSSPTNDQVFNAVSAVDVSLALEPALQVDHQLQVLLNGRADPDWPAGALSRTLVNLNRGSYTLSVRVLDLNGRALCAGPTINFHVRQPSILAPGRKPPAKKP
jgi:hypothetical protein